MSITKEEIELARKLTRGQSSDECQESLSKFIDAYESAQKRIDELEEKLKAANSVIVSMSKNLASVCEVVGFNGEETDELASYIEKKLAELKKVPEDVEKWIEDKAIYHATQQVGILTKKPIFNAVGVRCGSEMVFEENAECKGSYISGAKEMYALVKPQLDRLKDAEKVIEFYASTSNWLRLPKRRAFGGEKAREYQKRWGLK